MKKRKSLTAAASRGKVVCWPLVVLIKSNNFFYASLPAWHLPLGAKEANPFACPEAALRLNPSHKKGKHGLWYCKNDLLRAALYFYNTKLNKAPFHRTVSPLPFFFPLLGKLVRAIKVSNRALIKVLGLHAGLNPQA